METDEKDDPQPDRQIRRDPQTPILAPGTRAQHAIRAAGPRAATLGPQKAA